MLQNLIEVPFRGNTLLLLDQDGQPLVAMKPIVDGMGLAWPVQFRKLKSDEKRWSITIMVTETAAGLRETICIPLRKLTAWLMSINPGKVPDPVTREQIIAYQNECDEVLWKYWTEGTVSREPRQPKGKAPNRPRLMELSAKLARQFQAAEDPDTKEMLLQYIQEINQDLGYTIRDTFGTRGQKSQKNGQQELPLNGEKQ